MNDFISQILAWNLHPRLKEKKFPSFNDWLTSFKKTAAGSIALQELESVERKCLVQKRDHPFSLLAARCLEACYFAAHYNKETDPGKTYRAEVASDKAAKLEIANTVHKLRNQLKSHPRTAMWAFPIAEFHLKSDEVAVPPDNIIKFLEKFEENLYGLLPEVDGGPFLYRFTFACLHYDQLRTKLKHPSTATALLFNLVLLFRKWTAYGSAYTASSEPMPDKTTGLPCYKVAVSLVNATLNQKLSDRDANNLIQSLIKDKKIGLRRWPNQEA